MPEEPKSESNVKKPVLYSPDIGREEPLIASLTKVNRMAVRAMAVLMSLVIVWGVLDIVRVLYDKLVTEPFLLLEISDVLGTFGAFMAVLIAIEIFVNITIYLREDVIHVKVVMATALMAVGRKVITMDFKDPEMSPQYVFGIAAVVLAVSIGYWLVVVHDKNGAGREGMH